MIAEKKPTIPPRRLRLGAGLRAVFEGFLVDPGFELGFAGVRRLPEPYLRSATKGGFLRDLSAIDYPARSCLRAV